MVPRIFETLANIISCSNTFAQILALQPEFGWKSSFLNCSYFLAPQNLIACVRQNMAVLACLIVLVFIIVTLIFLRDEKSGV